MRVAQNNNNDAVVADLKGLGLFDRVMAEVPATGLVRVEVSSPHGTKLFVGRFVSGQSLGWASVTIPGASLDSPVVRDVLERIQKFYGGEESRSFPVAGVGLWEAAG